QAEEGIGLGLLPGLLGRLAAEAAPLLDGAACPRTSDLPTLEVVGVVLETALRSVLVDLGRDALAPMADDPDLGLFTGLQAADDLLDDPVGQDAFQILVHFVFRRRSHRRAAPRFPGA